MDKIEWINVWYDNAGHYLDVFWASKAGNSLMPTSNERVDVLVDDDRNLSGFMVWGVTRIREGEIVHHELTPVEPEPIAAVTATRPDHPRRFVQPETMAEIENISIYADENGDCFELHWAAKPNATYTATSDDRVQALKDADGNILGFKISGISLMGESEKDFINVALYPGRPVP